MFSIIENFTRQTYGPIPVVRALAESLNLATIGVGMDVGLSKISQTLQRFGLPRAPAEVPSMLLGAIDVTPMEAAQMYNGLANGGFRTNLRAVRAVISADGKTIRRSTPAGSIPPAVSCRATTRGNSASRCRNGRSQPPLRGARSVRFKLAPAWRYVCDDR